MCRYAAVVHVLYMCIKRFSYELQMYELHCNTLKSPHIYYRCRIYMAHLVVHMDTAILDNAEN